MRDSPSALPGESHLPQPRSFRAVQADDDLADHLTDHLTDDLTGYLAAASFALAVASTICCMTLLGTCS